MKSRILDFMQKRCAALVCAAIAAFAVAGCASDYNRYASTSVDMAKASEATKTARFTALQSLGCNTTFILDDTGKKVTKQEVKCDPETQRFAAFALAVAGMQAKDEAAARIEAPYTLGQGIRDVAGLIVPLANVGAQIYGIQKNASVAVAQSNNSRDIAVSTNSTMAGIAGSGFNAVSNVAGAGFNAMSASATAFGAKPTYQITVNGDDNALFGSTTSRTIKVDCPLVADARSGTAGTGGNGANGGQGGNSAGAGPAGAGASGGAGAPGGASGTALQTSNVNCIAGK